MTTTPGPATRFRGRVVSTAAIDGVYHFAVVKTGPAGTSAVRQNGRFSALPDVETLVGSTTVSVEPGAEYDVDFSVEVGGRTFGCERATGGRI